MENAGSNGAVDSPCIGVCTLHSSGFCLGCWRSMDEISHWLEYSREQRIELMQTQLPQRQQAYFDSIG